ncbi:hypothetical protein M378DRAFT_171529 [Amanita muscaria Koide BX008]|uniref:Uncharacterized protein n=1 Tax=Amanita muscaria (strain Koide BX008) TaxID=946122 RepID=A0A0C2WLQ5_AMAMK|nr:hypothetical protein M378DRAFT_171529 [Amanita muscaria Koide BX008]
MSLDKSLHKGFQGEGEAEYAKSKRYETGYRSCRGGDRWEMCSCPVSVRDGYQEHSNTRSNRSTIRMF